MPYPTTDTTELIALIRARSLQRGTDVKLSSGNTSAIYINLKPTIFHPRGNRLIGSTLYGFLAQNPPDYVAGPELGGAHIATALCSISTFSARPIPALAIRKNAKAHGTQSLIEGLTHGESLDGKRITVVEDVTTTGGSAMKAIGELKNHGATVIQVLSVVDREEGAAGMFAKAGIAFRAALTLSDLR